MSALIMCGNCRTTSIPKVEGVHYCMECKQGHHIRIDENEQVYIDVYPSPKYDGVKVFTHEVREEFKKLKRWVQLCPIEAAMRIQELEEQIKQLEKRK